MKIILKRQTYKVSVNINILSQINIGLHRELLEPTFYSYEMSGGVERGGSDGRRRSRGGGGWCLWVEWEARLKAVSNLLTAINCFEVYLNLYSY